MTVEPTRRRNLWHIIWNFTAGAWTLAVVLLLTSLFLSSVLFLPQAPSDPAAASHWLARVQVRFGSAVDPLNALGLFSLGRSPLFRLLLAALAFLLVVRSVKWAERLWRDRRANRGEGQWQAVRGGDLEWTARKLSRRGFRVRVVREGNALQADRWPWAELLAVLAHVGPLLLLLGLLAGELGGWRAEYLVGAPGEVISVPEHGEITLLDRSSGLGVDEAGVQVYVVGTGPELTVTAEDTEGNLLSLQQTPDASSSRYLRLRLTGAAEDVYFAIPRAGLIVRITPEPEAALDAEMPLRVQVFRSPSGELVQESVVTENVELTEGGISIQFRRARYLILTAAHDPGHWLKMVGLVVTGLAILGAAVWPARRLWVRRDGSQLAGTGDLPRGFLEGSEEARRPKWRPRWKDGLRILVGFLAPVVSGAAVWNLAQGGVLWDGSAMQAGMTALWMAGTAVWRGLAVE